MFFLCMTQDFLTYYSLKYFYELEPQLYHFVKDIK